MKKATVAGLLAAVLLLVFCGCALPSSLPQFPDIAQDSPADDAAKDEPAVEASTAGEDLSSEKTFQLTVIDGSGQETVQEITTEENTVGAALLREGIISGYDTPFGFVVMQVNGIACSEKEGTCWEFLVNGEYSPASCSLVPAEAGTNYTFRME